jgi:hypothetical protein
MIIEIQRQLTQLFYLFASNLELILDLSSFVDVFNTAADMKHLILTTFDHCRTGGEIVGMFGCRRGLGEEARLGCCLV